MRKTLDIGAIADVLSDVIELLDIVRSDVLSMQQQLGELENEDYRV
tara:strand:- start:258 stop:395 length:138 start_codon:yes stop_codon:yes gene_type:complete